MKKIRLTILALPVAALLAGCPAVWGPPVDSSPSAMPSGQPTGMPTGMSTGTPAAEYKQIERLARPAINEGLLTTNALLNTWNMVPPTADTTAAAQPIAAEATTTLKALGNSQERIDALFAVLLPDVMRIDTSVPSGYATLTENLRPVGGRLITDDVMDITLGLIVPDATASAVEGPLRTDNVSYEQAHDPLLNEFPYLTPPK